MKRFMLTLAFIIAEIATAADRKRPEELPRRDEPEVVRKMSHLEADAAHLAPLVDFADVVIHGTVVSAADDTAQGVSRRYGIRVTTGVKGASASTVVAVFGPGGCKNGSCVSLSDGPELKIGDEVILFGKTGSRKDGFDLLASVFVTNGEAIGLSRSVPSSQLLLELTARARARPSTTP